MYQNRTLVAACRTFSGCILSARICGMPNNGIQKNFLTISTNIDKCHYHETVSARNRKRSLRLHKHTSRELRRMFAFTFNDHYVLS